MAGFAVVVGVDVAGAPVLSYGVFLGFLAAFAICGAGNTINDYFDHDIDSVNNPSRPIPAGRISPETAYRYSLLLFSAGVAMAFFINVPAVLLAVFNALVLYLYAERIKRWGGLTKNLTVSYLVASPFLFGGIVAGDPGVTLILVLIALLVNVSREITKDIEDYEGDVGHLESLPVRFGFNIAGLIVTVFLIASISLSPIPYILGIVGNSYLLFIGVADSVLIYCGVEMLRSPREKAGAVQRLMKAGMFLALLGFLLGSV